MKAIVTKYLGATDYRGSRIVATAEGGHRVTVRYDHGASDPHNIAAVALCKKLGWTGELIAGGLPDGRCVYVFAHCERITIA